MTTKPRACNPTTLRVIAEEFRANECVYAALLEHALAWDCDLLAIAEAKQGQVSGFYAEEHPQFRQGEPAHELEELVTAEDCTSMVRAIVGMQEDVRALLAAIDRELPSVVYYPVRLPVDIVNKVRKRVDLPELK